MPLLPTLCNRFSRRRYLLVVVTRAPLTAVTQVRVQVYHVETPRLFISHPLPDMDMYPVNLWDFA